MNLKKQIEIQKMYAKQAGLDEPKEAPKPRKRPRGRPRKERQE